MAGGPPMRRASSSGKSSSQVTPIASNVDYNVFIQEIRIMLRIISNEKMEAETATSHIDVTHNPAHKHAYIICTHAHMHARKHKNLL